MGCSSSKSVEVYSTKVARPEPLENGHLVALTSSTLGLLKLDSQNKSKLEDAKEVDDPVNQMYQRMMNLDAPGSQLPQSWSEVSTALSKLKSEAQNKATSGPRARSVQSENTVNVAELLHDAGEEEEVSSQVKPLPVEEQPKLARQASKRRDVSVIHTLEEVDKLAIVPVVPSPGEGSDSDDDEFFQPPFYPNNRSEAQSKRMSMSVRSRPSELKVKEHHKSSKSMSAQSSTLFDEEFLESFKEAFEQLSSGVPSTTAPAAASLKSAAKGNKISTSSQLGANKTTPFKTNEQNASSPVKPTAQRKVRAPDQKPVKDDAKLTPNSKVKNNVVKQEGSPPLNTTTNKVKQRILETNRLSSTNQLPETNRVTNKFKNHEVLDLQRTELSNSSRRKEMPVFSNKQTQAKSSEPSPLLQLPKKCPPDGENKIVLYSTSLRGIRKTFEDCNTVRSLLHSFNVEVDERDVSMDSNYRQELRELMDKPVAVPRLFIKGRYVGGAEDVVGIHEAGGLEKLLQGIPRGNLSKDCDGCGGMRFIPCTDCNGSCKAVADDGKIIKCPDCNENGLVRCPICS